MTKIMKEKTNWNKFFLHMICVVTISIVMIFLPFNEYEKLGPILVSICIGSIMLVADPFSKGISSMIINCLPYVRKEDESKAKIIYNKMSSKELIYCLTATIIPLIWFPNLYYLFVLLFPLLIFTLLITLMKNKIQGYTGDCCGALFLLCELSFYLGSAIIYHTT